MPTFRQPPSPCCAENVVRQPAPVSALRNYCGVVLMSSKIGLLLSVMGLFFTSYISYLLFLHIYSETIKSNIIYISSCKRHKFGLHGNNRGFCKENGYTRGEQCFEVSHMTANSLCASHSGNILQGLILPTNYQTACRGKPNRAQRVEQSTSTHAKRICNGGLTSPTFGPPTACFGVSNTAIMSPNPPPHL